MGLRPLLYLFWLVTIISAYVGLSTGGDTSNGLVYVFVAAVASAVTLFLSLWIAKNSKRTILDWIALVTVLPVLGIAGPITLIYLLIIILGTIAG